MTKLKRYPTQIIPNETIPTNTAINCHFSTFFRIIISGSKSAITYIINASAVPSETLTVDSAKVESTKSAKGQVIGGRLITYLGFVFFVNFIFCNLN